MNPLQTQHFHLPTGQLSLDIAYSELPISELFDLGARQNPKRAFLFVSKVLGKHIPCSPFVMRRVSILLATKLAHQLGATSTKPIVFIGMAETATALAQGVFETWLQETHTPALYLQTTRLRVKNATVCPFEEAHSHANNLFLHLPTNPAHQAMLHQAEQLVLIDDELSTGNTFRNLHAALREKMPHLTNVHWLCLTDFSPDDVEESVEIKRYSLLKGRWNFVANQMNLAEQAIPLSQGEPVFVSENNFGRTGISTLIRLPESLLKAQARRFNAQDKILVIGVGEFIYPPTVFARELARRSQAEVRVQSSTRSPALNWGALQHKQPFPDPYDEGVHYYLYNLPEKHDYSHIFICHEHPANAALLAFAQQLNAELIQLEENECQK